MAQSFFIWNGKDCRSMGIIMRGPAAIIRPEERVKHVEIPGVSGDVTETEGQNIFNSYIQTVSISVRGGFRVNKVYEWLRGAGYVTFSGEPDRRQKARVIGAITLNRVSRNLDNWAGEVQFYCQPLKERMAEEKVTVSASGAVVRNNGDVICKPMWKVTPSAATAKIKAAGAGITGDDEITITGLTSGVVVWVDSDTMEVWNADRTALVTKNSTGDFPVLGQGVNTVTGEGWSALEIQKRERFL
jgi:phage-related protein